MNSQDFITTYHSDNVFGANPEIAKALVDACSGVQMPYGADGYSVAVENQLKDIFETDLRVFLVPTGTAANALSLAVMTPPWGSVLCHQESHIHNDECGAPEFFCHGAKLTTMAGAHCKISAHGIATLASQKHGDVHSVQAKCVSISQATESGSVYSLAEIHAVAEACAEHNLSLHMDGARFANALVSLSAKPADMTWRAGVKVLSLGATKNGALGVDAVVLFDLSLADAMAFRRKRAGHLTSKMRLLSAQMQAYLSNDLWLKNAQQANAMAQRLAQGLQAINGVSTMGSQQSNILFCRFPNDTIATLLGQGFGFYHNRWGEGVVRVVTSFAHRPKDIDYFLDAIQRASKANSGQ